MCTVHSDDSLEPLPVDGTATNESEIFRVVPASHPLPLPQSSATFTRLTTLHPALLAELPTWWRVRRRGTRVHATGRLDLDAPQCDRSGTWRMYGRLHPRLHRPIGVELQLWPRLGAWTKVSMQPQRRVHVGRRYFRLGHRALDSLSEQLGAELRPARSVTPPVGRPPRRRTR